jgi:hypothetical protein
MQTLDPYWPCRIDQYKRVSGFVNPDTVITTSPVTEYIKAECIIHTKTRHAYRLGRKLPDSEAAMLWFRGQLDAQKT